MIRAAAFLGAATVLVACSSQVNKVVVRPEAFPVHARAAMPRLSCAYQLKALDDARAAGNHAGGLGRHQLVLEDAPTFVERYLTQAGITRPHEPATGSAREVSLQIKQLYLTQNQTTKIPVAVYSVWIEGEEAFLIRSQAASMNWNGSQDEAHRALAQALDDASQRLVTALNARCGAPAARSPDRT